MKTIDLSAFNSFDVTDANSANFRLTRPTESTMRLDVDSGSTGYIYYNIPGKMPVGTKITLTAEVAYVSDSFLRLVFDTYSDGDYKTGKIAGEHVHGSTDISFRKVKTTMTVEPEQQYVRIVLGYFSSFFGISEIRNIKIDIEEIDDVIIKPDEYSPVIYSRHYGIDEMNRDWVESVTGAGSITKAVDKITIAAAYADRAVIRISPVDDQTNRNRHALHNLEDSNGIIVDVKITNRTGFPIINVDYLKSTGAFIGSTRKVYMGNDGEWYRCYFPVFPEAVIGLIDIGAFTTNDCDFDLHEVRVSQLGKIAFNATKSMQFIGCVIRKVAAGWEIDRDSVVGGADRFASANVEDITTNALDLRINFSTDGYRNVKPILQAAVDSNLDRPINYYVGLKNSDRDGVNLVFYNRSTDAVIDPSTISNLTYVSILGFTIY